MSDTDELYPPVQYGWGWILLALGVIALVIVVIWLILLLTRPKRRIALVGEAGSQVPTTGDVLSMLRTEYTAEIARIEAAYADGTITARTANLELSRLVRRFVNEYSGLEAPVLALDDLVRLGVQPALIDAIHRHYYPGVFRRGASIDPRAGAEAARKVVATWH